MSEIQDIECATPSDEEPVELGRRFAWRKRESRGARAELGPAIGCGPYPERPVEKLGWLDDKGVRSAAVLMRRWRARSGQATSVVKQAGELEAGLQELSEPALREMATGLRVELIRQGFEDAIVARCFALIREVARRTLGQRHHDVQLMGGWVMLSGMIAEMDTGEGKTLTATLPAATVAMAGIPVHVISVNDYLVSRDAETMAPVYEMLGLSVGTIRQGMDPDARRVEYGRDITYCSNKEIAFDYLKDRIALGRVRSHARLGLERLAQGRSRADQLVLRGLWFAIVDEADSVLVDEARTPLIISSGGKVDEFEEEVYETAIALAQELEPERDFRIDARERGIRLTPEGQDLLAKLAERLTGVFRGPHRREEFVNQALSALHLFERDKQYLVSEGKIQIIDEYTGRVMPDRSWQAGLHQMIEAKEAVEISGSTETLAKISYQRFFRRYLRLSGMTGTAKEVAPELFRVNDLPVVRIPTNRPSLRRGLGERVYADEDQKWQAVVERIVAVRSEGRPVLVGTRSVAASEHLSHLLDAARVPHRVLNARQDAEEADIVSEAGLPGTVTVATNMAGRGTDIKLSAEVEAAGGLHVIATERHEAQRIDRQLFGRCGRQGDRGSYEMIVSLEDELFHSHGAGFGQLLRLADVGDEDRRARSFARRIAVRLAQRRGELLHARMRAALLKGDDQVTALLSFSGKGE